MKRVICFLILMIGCWSVNAQSSKVGITTFPSKIYIEKTSHQQYIHFDCHLKNVSTDTFSVYRIEMTALDKGGNLITRKHLDEVALSPSIHILPVRVIAPGKTINIFNPFYAFEPDFEISSLKYIFSLRNNTDKEESLQVSIQVQPTYYVSKTALSFPLSNLTLVKDGHDFYSHHRRVDLTHPVASMMGLQTNSGLFALDLCPVNEQMQLYKNKGEANEDWFGYGAVVKSPGKGKVVAICDTVSDNKPGSIRLDYSTVKGNLLLLSGNYVLIDHLNGEYSLLAHLQRNSLLVQVGEDIITGQTLGKLGNSGSSLEPHLHYQLMSAPDMNAQALPVYFTNIRRKAGRQVLKLQQGSLQTGDIILP